MSVNNRGGYESNFVNNSLNYGIKLKKQEIHNDKFRKNIFMKRKDFDLMNLLVKRGINKQIKIIFPSSKIKQESPCVSPPQKKHINPYKRKQHKIEVNTNNISKGIEQENKRRERYIEMLQKYERDKCKKLFCNESLRYLMFHKNENNIVNSFIEFKPFKYEDDTHLSISSDKIQCYSFKKKVSRNEKYLLNKDYSLPDINKGRVIDSKYKNQIKKNFNDAKSSSSVFKETSPMKRMQMIIKKDNNVMMNEQASQT